MAQFDPIIIFSLLWSLLLALTLHYYIVLETSIPFFFGTKKFREKLSNSLLSRKSTVYNFYNKSNF